MVKIVAQERRVEIVGAECPTCEGTGRWEVEHRDPTGTRESPLWSWESCGTCGGEGRLDLTFEHDRHGWVMDQPGMLGEGDDLETALTAAHVSDGGKKILYPGEVKRAFEEWASRFGAWVFTRTTAIHPLVELVAPTAPRGDLSLRSNRSAHAMTAALRALAAPEVSEWIERQGRRSSCFDTAGDQLPVVGDGDVVAAGMTEEVER